MFKCKECNKEFADYNGLRRHSGRVHKVTSQDFYVQFYLNGVRPTCKCGCGEFTKWNVHRFREKRDVMCVRTIIGDIIKLQ